MTVIPDHLVNKQEETFKITEMWSCGFRECWKIKSGTAKMCHLNLFREGWDFENKEIKTQKPEWGRHDLTTLWEQQIIVKENEAPK